MTWEEPEAQGWELGWEQAKRSSGRNWLEWIRAEITENKEVTYWMTHLWLQKQSLTRSIVREKVIKWYKRDTKALVREGRRGSERRCARGESPCPQHLLSPLNPSPAMAWGFQKNQTLCSHLHMCDKHPLPQPQGASYESLLELSKFKTKAPAEKGKSGNSLGHFLGSLALPGSSSSCWGIFSELSGTVTHQEKPLSLSPHTPIDRAISW